jgi:hypothetical protein
VTRRSRSDTPYQGFTFKPDIYEVSSSVNFAGQNAYTISLAKTHGLNEGETVRLITVSHHKRSAASPALGLAH